MTTDNLPVENAARSVPKNVSGKLKQQVVSWAIRAGLGFSLHTFRPPPLGLKPSSHPVEKHHVATGPATVFDSEITRTCFILRGGSSKEQKTR